MVDSRHDDFLRQYECKIDYSTSVIKINLLPFEIPLLRNIPQQSFSYATNNARTETVVPLELINSYNISDGIVYAEKNCDDDFLIIPNSIVKIQNNNLGLITVS